MHCLTAVCVSNKDYNSNVMQFRLSADKLWPTTIFSNIGFENDLFCKIFVITVAQ